MISYEKITEGPYDAIVISGLGLRIYTIYGMLCYLNVKPIKAIYSTSGGCIPALAYILDFTFNEYISLSLGLIPVLGDVVKVDLNCIYNFFAEGNIFNNNDQKILFMAILKARNLDENTTLLELYNYTSIVYNVNVINTYTEKMEIVNYLTYPNMTIVDACIACISVPFVYSGRTDMIDAGFSKYSMYEDAISDGFNPLVCHIYAPRRTKPIRNVIQAFTTIFRYMSSNAELIRPSKGSLLRIEQHNTRSSSEQYICQCIDELIKYIES